MNTPQERAERDRKIEIARKARTTPAAIAYAKANPHIRKALDSTIYAVGGDLGQAIAYDDPQGIEKHLNHLHQYLAHLEALVFVFGDEDAIQKLNDLFGGPEQ
jgi:hypothetical protein